jgi:ribosome maturation factor RimP
VGSPGLDRPLIARDDFARFAGEPVRVQTRAPVHGRRRFSGKLIGVEGDAVQLELDGQLVTLPLGEIAKANLIYDF